MNPFEKLCKQTQAGSASSKPSSELSPKMHSKAASSSSSAASNESDDSLIVDFPTQPRRLSHTKPTASNKAQTSSPSSLSSPREVRFSDSSDTRLLMDKERLSNLDKQWYGKSEYKTFRKTLKKDVAIARDIAANSDRRPSPNMVSMFDESVSAMMQSSDNLRYEEKSDRDSINGIEKFVCPQTLMQVEMNRRQHQNAVLHAQGRQASPEQLRRASLEFSEWSLELAMSLAKIDD